MLAKVKTLTRTIFTLYLFEVLHPSPAPWWARILGNLTVTPIIGIAFGLAASYSMKMLRQANNQRIRDKGESARMMTLLSVSCLVFAYLTAESLGFASGLLSIMVCIFVLSLYANDTKDEKYVDDRTIVFQLLLKAIQALAFSA